MPDEKTARAMNWVGPIVTFGVIALVVALVLPAVQQSREAARRAMSKNNLKIIGLALHNYHDVHGVFPPGGVFNAEGKGLHGWMTLFHPFVESSPFYNGLNFDIPWDDPQQIERFMINISFFQNPSREPKKSPDNLPLAQFSANQWLFHRNSSMRINDIETGTSNTLAVAEAFGNFVPFGYPYIWRDPLLPLNSSPDSFGYHATGMHSLLMDGSVRWISKDMAAEIHESFAGPEKLRPMAEQVAKPSGEYRLSITPWRTHVVFSDPHWNLALTVRTNSNNQPILAKMDLRYDKGSRPADRAFDEAIAGLEIYPALLRFDGGNFFSNAALQRLSSFRQLHEIEIGGKRITDEGAAYLAAFPALTTLTLDLTEVTAKGLEELMLAPKLSKLTIIEPAFGDEGLAALAQFPSLAEADLIWYIRPVKVTPAAMAKLLEANPGLKLRVRYDGRVFNDDDIRDLPADAERPANGGK